MLIFNDLANLLVPRPGLEPGWVAPLVFETSASTDSAIWARFAGAKIMIIFETTNFYNEKLSKSVKLVVISIICLSIITRNMYNFATLKITILAITHNT